MALTAKQLVILRMAPFDGLCPGSNYWHEVCYTKDANPAEVAFDGEEVEPLIRIGFLLAEPIGKIEYIPGEHSELGKVEITHTYRRTDAGNAALAAV